MRNKNAKEETQSMPIPIANANADAAAGFTARLMLSFYAIAIAVVNKAVVLSRTRPRPSTPDVLSGGRSRTSGVSARVRKFDVLSAQDSGLNDPGLAVANESLRANDTVVYRGVGCPSDRSHFPTADPPVLIDNNGPQPTNF